MAMVAAVSFLGCLYAGEATKEEPKSEASGKTEPLAVGDEAKLLMRKVTMELVDTPLAEACDFIAQLTKLKIATSQGIGEKTVSLKLKNATVAEALRQIKDQAGGVYRVVNGEVRIATADEFAAIDAGKAKFKAYEPKTEETLPVKKPDAKPRADEKKQGGQAPSGEARQFSFNGKDYSEKEFAQAFPELYAKVVDSVKNRGPVTIAALHVATSSAQAITISTPDVASQELLKETAKIGGGVSIQISSGRPGEYSVNGKTYSSEQFSKEFPALSKVIGLGSDVEDPPAGADQSKRSYKVDGKTVSEDELKRTDPKVHRLLKAQEEQ
jgi:hypothetical protein